MLYLTHCDDKRGRCRAATLAVNARGASRGERALGAAFLGFRRSRRGLVSPSEGASRRIDVVDKDRVADVRNRLEIEKDSATGGAKAVVPSKAFLADRIPTWL